MAFRPVCPGGGSNWQLPCIADCFELSVGPVPAEHVMTAGQSGGNSLLRKHALMRCVMRRHFVAVLFFKDTIQTSPGDAKFSRRFRFVAIVSTKHF